MKSFAQTRDVGPILLSTTSVGINYKTMFSFVVTINYILNTLVYIEQKICPWSRKNKLDIWESHTQI